MPQIAKNITKPPAIKRMIEILSLFTKYTLAILDTEFSRQSSQYTFVKFCSKGSSAPYSLVVTTQTTYHLSEASFIEMKTLLIAVLSLLLCGASAIGQEKPLSQGGVRQDAL
ncbi:MAG: hypothetical protein IPO41_05595 [Acidobacteria bacterium]|nr:hypothetical protein [Acidobacteriota bacterium]